MTETELNELRACVADLRKFIETIPDLPTDQMLREAGGILYRTVDTALKYNCYRENNKEEDELIPFSNIRLFTDGDSEFYHKKIEMLERERKKNEAELLKYECLLAEIDGLIHQDLEL